MPEHTITDEWIRQALDGDRSAYTRLFAAYRPRLVVFTRYRIPEVMAPLIEVDDVLQELFSHAFAELDRFEYRGPGSFFAWLATRASNLVKTKLRYYGRKKRRFLGLFPRRDEGSYSQPEEPADTQTPTRIYAHQEKLSAFMMNLDSLPPLQREAILLAKIEGLSIAECARQMELTRSAFSVLLHRALKHFRQQLDALQTTTVPRHE